MSRVLVIVVTFNGMHWLQRCLSSVAGEDLYVWDNASMDGSAELVAAQFPEARLVRSPENVGFARANNAGMQYALEQGYDYVYLLNQDAWLEEGALQKLLEAAAAQPGFAVLSPLQMTEGFKALDARFEEILRFAQNDKIMEVKRVMAAHWLVPVKAIRELGLFDEEFFPIYGQDDDFCQRARAKGWKIGVVPGARGVHDRAQRQEPLERVVYRNYYTSALLKLKDPSRPLWLSACYVFLFTLVKAVKYRSRLPLKSFRTLLPVIPVIRRAHL